MGISIAGKTVFVLRQDPERYGEIDGHQNHNKE